MVHGRFLGLLLFDVGAFLASGLPGGLLRWRGHARVELCCLMATATATDDATADATAEDVLLTLLLMLLLTLLLMLLLRCEAPAMSTASPHPRH